MDISSLLPAPGTAAGAAAAKSSDPKGPTQDFLAYMAKTPAERMRDSWLASRNLSEADLKAMSPQEREAIEQQMAEDIKAQMIEEARTKALKAENNTRLSLSAFLATTP